MELKKSISFHSLCHKLPSGRFHSDNIWCGQGKGKPMLQEKSMKRDHN